MKRIVLTGITGSTYPISVYIADLNLNNQTLIGTINTGPVPPQVDFYSTIPSVFQTANEVIILLKDSLGCQLFSLNLCITPTPTITLTPSVTPTTPP